MPPKKWNPENYDKQCVLQYNTAMSMLNALEFTGKEKVLDIGCGTGKITHQIATQRLKTGTILGLDINPDMINFAVNHYKANNLNFVSGDVLDMDYEDHFDVALSFWTLSWVPLDAQLKALNKIINSLNENGQLFLMYPLKHDAYDVVDSVIKKPDWAPYFTNYTMPRSFITEEQYTDEIIKHIPMEINVTKKEIMCRYKSDEEMIASVSCWLAHVDEIPLLEDKKRFLLDVIIAYKQHRGTNEPIIYYTTLEITGFKNTFQLLKVC